MSESKYRFLHVEDDDGDAKIVQRAMGREFLGEYTMDRAMSMDEALASLSGTSYSAVLLDLHLLDSYGLKNVQTVSSRYPDVPIVVISAMDDTETVLNALECGAQEFLVKDFSNPRTMGLAVRSSMARKAHQRELVRRANHDMLTGLLNRRMFMEYMQNRLASADRWGRGEALLFSDVNQFKRVNDTLGHRVGDQLLKEVGSRLQSTLRSSDVLARYAGDEFVIHLDCSSETTTDTECIRLANRITQSFREPVLIGGHQLQASLSIGIAFFPTHGKTLEQLIESADTAMYLAKRQGLPYCLAP